LPEKRLHDLRHTYATDLYAADVHPRSVQELLGHSRLDMTNDLHTGSVPAALRDAVERLDRARANSRQPSLTHLNRAAPRWRANRQMRDPGPLLPEHERPRWRCWRNDSTATAGRPMMPTPTMTIASTYMASALLKIALAADPPTSDKSRAVRKHPGWR
jgi:hypothetical protein